MLTDVYQVGCPEIVDFEAEDEDGGNKVSAWVTISCVVVEDEIRPNSINSCSLSDIVEKE